MTAFDLGDMRSPESKARGVTLIDSPFGVDAVAAGSFDAQGPILAAEFEACAVEGLGPSRYNVFVLTADFLGGGSGLRATHLAIVRAKSREDQEALTDGTVREWVKRQHWREVGGVGVDGGTAGFFDSRASELYGLPLGELQSLLTDAMFERGEACSEEGHAAAETGVGVSQKMRTTVTSLALPALKPPRKGGTGHAGCPAQELMRRIPTTPRPTSSVVLPEVTRAVGQELFASCSNLGVVCSAGFGDGGYPVFVNTGCTAAVLEFISADDLAPEA